MPKTIQTLLVSSHNQLRFQAQLSELWKLIDKNLLWTEVIHIMCQSLLAPLLKNFRWKIKLSCEET